MSYVRSPTPITLGWLWFQDSRSYGVGALERDGGKKNGKSLLDSDRTCQSSYLRRYSTDQDGVCTIVISVHDSISE